MGHPLIDSATKKNGGLRPWDGDVFVFPATVGQQGFWYLDQLDPGNPSYNIAVRFQLEGPLLHAALVRAMNEVIVRDESLRTVIIEVDGQPVQVIAPSLSIPVPLTDLRNVPRAQRESQSDVLTVEEARRRFDLSTGPLIRASLMQLDDENHVLLVTVHHIVSDGWSIGVITDELGELYDAYCRGLESTLEDLPLQYGDFSVWQKRWLGSSQLKEQFIYWTNKLAELPLLEIPTDRPRPPIQTSNGHIESILLPRVLTKGLQELCSREGVTLFMLSLAVLKVLLLHTTGQDDIFVGTLVAGRSRVELERLIGLFINPLVLRTDLSGDPTFLELLAQVRTTVVEALARSELPFERIVQAIQPKRDMSRHPVFQINFIYQRDFVKPLEVSGLTLTALPSRSPGAIYDLNFFMVERADGWRASCEYNTDLYEAATVNRLLSQFQALLIGSASEPGRRISQIPLVTALDRELWLPAAEGVSRRWSGARSDHSLHGPSFVAPRDETEALLTKMWQRILGLEKISCAADFFDEGGHSLQIARVLAETERTFGRRMSMAAFLQAPTIQGMRAFLSGDRIENLSGQVIEIQTKGSRPPFAILDIGTIFRELLRHLDSDQPVYGLVMPELSKLPKRFTVQDIAANLIVAWREVRPHGPYTLGGWSHAGVVAYEMARQLQASGEDVKAVILFDTNSPAYLRKFRGPKALPVRIFILIEKTIYHSSRIVQLKPIEVIDYIRERLRTIKGMWQLRFWRLWYRALEQPKAAHLDNSTDFQFLATEDYMPEPCMIPLVLFRSTVLQTGPFRDPKLGWGELALGGLKVHVLPGNHAGMFVEPALHQMAEKLAEHLGHPVTVRPVKRTPIMSESKALRT